MRFKVASSPPRLTVKATVSPTECSPRRVPREEFAPILKLLTAKMMSPCFRPAFSAGEFLTTFET